MSDPDRVRRRQPAGAASGAKGWIGALLGVFVLLASYQLPDHTLPATLAVALRPVAWLAVALGLIYVGIQRLARGGPQQSAGPEGEDDPQIGMTRPSVLQALGVGRGAPEVEPRFVDTIAVHPAHSAQAEVDDDPPARETQWGPRVLAQMDWRHFESLCRAFFTQAGFSTSAQGHGPDGGVDIWVQSRHMPEPRIVRCRHWEGEPVQVKELRDFLAVMTGQGLEHGTYVTSSTFSPEAVEFAKANGIQTQDGAQILKLISHRTPEQQAALLEVAYGTPADNEAR